MNTGKEKGKEEASSSQGYLKKLLSNTRYRQLTMLKHPKLERLIFGPHNLINCEPSNLTFILRPDVRVDKSQIYLIDNLWISYNKRPRDPRYFISVLNALSYYFTEKKNTNKFKFYVVLGGKTQGVVQTWIEVMSSVKDYTTPLYKSFNDLKEALDYARGNLGQIIRLLQR